MGFCTCLKLLALQLGAMLHPKVLLPRAVQVSIATTKGHGGYDSFGSYGHGAHGKGKSYGEKGKASAPPKENYRQLRILPAELADLTVPKDRT